jgi:hypothetical protein
MIKFKRSVNKVKMMGAMDSLPLHYFKEHQQYKGKDKLSGSDRKREQRILESLHGQFHNMLEDVEFLHRCFTLLDGDDDGRLNAAELKRWISVLNDGEPTNEELKDALDIMPGKGGVEIDGEIVLENPALGVEFEDFLGVRANYLPCLPPLSLLPSLASSHHRSNSGRSVILARSLAHAWCVVLPDHARLLHWVGGGPLAADLRGHAGAGTGRESRNYRCLEIFCEACRPARERGRPSNLSARRAHLSPAS